MQRKFHSFYFKHFFAAQALKYSKFKDLSTLFQYTLLVMSLNNKIKTNLADGILINSLLLACLIYLLTIYRFAFDQPYGDDYDAILAFLNHYVQVSPSEQIQLFFSQHNEHRILLSRLAAIIDLSFFGHINFIHLIWLGTCGWFFAIYALWFFSKKYGIAFIEFTPAAILLLSFSHYEMMTWAMTSIQQYWQVTFGIMAIGFMVNGNFYRSNIFYIAAIFTSGGGMALVPLINLYYLANQQWKNFFLCAGLTAIVLLTYFILLPYQSPPTKQLIEILFHPHLFFAYFFGFVGGLGKIQSLGLASYLLAGLVLFVVFIKKVIGIKNHCPFYFWLCFYVLLTAVLAALNRSFLGVETSGDSRYSEYSLLFAASTYLAYIYLAKGKDRVWIVWIGFAIAMVVFAYWHETSKPYLIDQRYWLENGLKTHPNWEGAQKIKARSIDLGVITK